MNKVILILGMHRSGTSALTRVISLMGAALPKSILGKNSSNLRGHWESEAMITAHDTLLMQRGSSWADWRRLDLGKKGTRAQRGAGELFIETFDSEFPNKSGVCVVKEPRICRFAAPYIQALKGTGVQLHSLLMVRNPLEVAASLAERDGLTKLDGLYLWLTYMLEAELATRKGSRHFISYDDFLASPVTIVKSINKTLPFPLPYDVGDVKKQIEAYVSPDLKRQSRAAEDIVLDPLARGWVSDAYEAFLVLCENPISKTALGTLDLIRESYFSIIDPLYEILSFENARLDAEFKDILAGHLFEHESAVGKLQDDHKQAWSLREEENLYSWNMRDDETTEAWESREKEHAEALRLLDLQHKKALDSKDQEHESAVGKLQDDHKQAWSLREEENLHSCNMRDDETTEALRLLDLQHKKALKALDSEHESAVGKLQDDHKQAWSLREEENARSLEQIQSEHSKAQAEWERSFARQEADYQATFAKMNDEISFMRDEFGSILRATEARADQGASEVKAVRAELSSVLSSTSWKMTHGLRRVMNALKGVKTHKPSLHLDSPDAPPRLEFKPGD